MKTTTTRANAIPGGISAHLLTLPMRLFSGEQITGYAVTKWRNWLIVGHTGAWFVVLKSAPTATPKAFNCSLSVVKAHLLNGSVVCND
jgi:hypothetical protein